MPIGEVVFSVFMFSALYAFTMDRALRRAIPKCLNGQRLSIFERWALANYISFMEKVVARL